MNVILGPVAALHSGIHGSLCQSPPRDVVYDKRDARHLLVYTQPVSDPFEVPASFEAVSFGQGDEISHSAYWPVLHRRRWCVETGDLGWALFCGHHGFNDEPQIGTADVVWHAMVARAKRMFAAYAHPSCKAVMLYTRREVNNVRRWIRHYAASGDRRVLSDKIRLLSPAIEPRPADIAQAKWASPNLNVIFCGRAFEVKNGALALDVIESLMPCFPKVSWTYVGSIPESVRVERRRLLDRLQYHDRISRAQIQLLFDAGHVLFHPSKAESLGMVLLEAAAAGMAIVCANDRGMEHVADWFGHSQAFIQRADRRRSQREQYRGVLSGLLTSPAAAKRVGLENYATVESGPLSLPARNGVLTAVYAGCGTASGEALELPACVGSGTHHYYELSNATLACLRARYRELKGLPAGALINMPLLK